MTQNPWPLSEGRYKFLISHGSCVVKLDTFCSILFVFSKYEEYQYYMSWSFKVNSLLAGGEWIEWSKVKIGNLLVLAVVVVLDSSWILENHFSW